MLTFLAVDDFTRCSTFSVAAATEESFISVATPEGLSFSEALGTLEVRYAAALDRLGLSDSTAIFCRIFLSDIFNQKSELVRSRLGGRLQASCALSVIEQKPIGSGPIALLSYHLRAPTKPLTKQLSRPTSDGWRNDLIVQGKNYSLLLTANQTSDESPNAYAQTQAILRSLHRTAENNGLSLLDNGIRTWIYVRDLDNRYQEMVHARREFFAEHGLTDNTRYLASTGILGATYTPERLVSLDSLSIGGLAQGQVVRMEARSHLRSTIAYGVTFERGLRVRFGDRSHLYLSGTASIDTKGDVLHEGDARLQTKRAIENVRALLAAQSASVDDLAYVIVYVRNAHDRLQVAAVIDDELGKKVPVVLTEAAVCRPAWLMELEGVAIIPDKNGFRPFL